MAGGNQAGEERLPLPTRDKARGELYLSTLGFLMGYKSKACDRRLRSSCQAPESLKALANPRHPNRARAGVILPPGSTTSRSRINALVAFNAALSRGSMSSNFSRRIMPGSLAAVALLPGTTTADTISFSAAATAVSSTVISGHTALAGSNPMPCTGCQL